jgi:hypothetical protein
MYTHPTFGTSLPDVVLLASEIHNDPTTFTRPN